MWKYCVTTFGAFLLTLVIYNFGSQVGPISVGESLIAALLLSILFHVVDLNTKNEKQ